MIGRSSARALLHHDALPLPVDFRPIRGARRLRLRIDDSGKLIRLTAPARYSRSKALAWAAEQGGWVEQQLRSRLPAEPFVPGALLPLLGTETKLEWIEQRPRAPAIEPGDPQRLVSGGPRSAFERRIERWLKRRALDVLGAETAAMAQSLGIEAAVSVGDAGTRWGSCSSDGRIRYSWRLVLAPPEVRRLVVAHEVAHLRHLDHGRQFKALERQLFGGDVAEARSLLRGCGPRLRRFGWSD